MVPISKTLREVSWSEVYGEDCGALSQSGRHFLLQILTLSQSVWNLQQIRKARGGLWRLLAR